jgi:hypothetical protein
MQTFTVTFDNGQTVEIALKSRDIAKSERLGIVMDADKPTIWMYRVAHLALQRMHRSGTIDFEIPASPEALEEAADIEMVEDDEGEGSGQAAATG